MRLGQVIRRWRTVEQKTLDEVANEIGIGRTVLQRIETGGQGDGKAPGKLEMNGATLGKLIVWLLSTVLLVAGAAVGQTPIAVGDILAGTCDSKDNNTGNGAVEVFDPNGMGVNEFDANTGINLCMEQMTVDVDGNTYVLSDGNGIFGFDPLGNKLQVVTLAKTGQGIGMQRLPTLSSILHDQAGNVYFLGGDGNLVSEPINGGAGGEQTGYVLPGNALRFALASDQHTMVYVAMDSGNVRSYDLTARQSGPDLVISGTAQTVLVLPDQSLVVRDRSGQVARWAPPCLGCFPYQRGRVYMFPDTVDNIALDPDGSSFRSIHVWYDDQQQLGNGNVYKTDVGSGQVLGVIDISGLRYGVTYSGSLGIYGDGLNSQALATATLKWPKPQPIGVESKHKTVAVKNTGAVEIIVSGVGVRADDGRTGEFRVVKNQCQKGIRPGTHCNVWVSYTPTAVGTQTGVVEVFGNVPGGKQTTRLSGIGK